ncbi:MAG: PEP-CTERM sorting domain-containing protein, partial [Puniceicoccaceae bacterium]
HSSNAFGSTNLAGVADNGLDYTNIQVAFTQVVPEPSAYALLLGGFAVMLAVARRKQRA